MALRRIECPHCEQSVEVDVTHVTRSRNCPNCGKPIMLQFTTTQKRTKRTALMVPSVDPVEKLGEAPHAERGTPRSLEGDVHDRMSHDPEVRGNLKRLLWGAGILASTITLLSVADHFQWWSFMGSGSALSKAQSPPTKAPDSNTTPETATTSNSDQPPPPPSPAPAPPSTPAPVASAPQPAPIPASPTSPVQPIASPVIVATNPGAIEEERGIRAVKAFLSAKTVEERLPWVRDVKVMEPIIRDYYKRHPDGPIAFTKVQPLPSLGQGTSIRKFDVHLADGTKRVAHARLARSGALLVDWASFVIYSPMEWDDLAKKRPTEPVFMRVLAQSDTRFTETFKANEYLCLKLTNPLNSSSAPLYAYVFRQAEAGLSLNMVLKFSGTDPVPMMLRIKHPPQVEGATGAQWEALVEEFVGEGWVTSGT